MSQLIWDFNYLDRKIIKASKVTSGELSVFFTVGRKRKYRFGQYVLMKQIKVQVPADLLRRCAGGVTTGGNKSSWTNSKESQLVLRVLLLLSFLTPGLSHLCWHFSWFPLARRSRLITKTQLERLSDLCGYCWLGMEGYGGKRSG